jgi:hypothetical protein
VLANPVGTSCGTCGAYECNRFPWLGGEPTTCNDPGANACGGCGDLAGQLPGQVCGTDQVLTCDGGDALTCSADRSATCSSNLECLLYTTSLGIDLTALGNVACDGEVGCYIKGQCSADGNGTAQDPFGAGCVGGSRCQSLLILGAVCVGCDPATNSGCRAGETCQTLLGQNYCAAPAAGP